MPNWIYQRPAAIIAIFLVASTVLTSLAGLFLARRVLLPHLKHHDGANEAVGGATHAIGVFYAVTVGLIAIGVWTKYENARDIVSREAMAAYTLYTNVASLPDPPRAELQQLVREYVETIVDGWPRQMAGEKIPRTNTQRIAEIRRTLNAIEPTTEGGKVRYNAAVESLNRLTEQRRLRLDVTETRLSGVMWSVILVGAGISITVAYLFRIADAKLHSAIVTLMAAFLGLVLFMIVINDRPFFGASSIQADSYQTVLDSMWDRKK